MRKQSRIKPEFLDDQKEKRTAQQDSPGDEKNVPALRIRIENLENLLSVRSYEIITNN